MKKQAIEERVDRRSIPSLLARKFIKDYQVSVVEFPENQKEEFLEHLLGCLDIVENYIASPTEENYRIYADKENAFLKKHGKRLKMYRQTRMYLYYGDHGLLVEKQIYTVDEWNSFAKDKQRLSKEEFADLFHLCRNSLYLEREYLWLSQNPEDESADKETNKSKETSEPLNGVSDFPKFKRFKGGRKPFDNLTCLNQEQTALLMYYLQHENVFLKSHYLDDTTMGIAFEILTGYSFNTLRQKVGKYTKSKTPENVKEISKLLTRLKTALDEA